MTPAEPDTEILRTPRPDRPEEVDGGSGRGRGWRFWGAILAVPLLAGAYFLLRRKPAEDRGPRPVPVVVAKARRADIPLHLSSLGTVVAQNAVTVRSRVDGHLMRIAFQEGQMLQEGVLLAEIDPRPFQVQLMQAEGQLAKDTAAHRNASADLERIRTLIAQGIVSRQQLDTQTAAVDQFAAAVKADQAQVESAKLNLTYARITAPVAGRVGLRLVEPGNMVRANDATGLAVITPLQPITVLFTVPSDQIRRVMASGRNLAVRAYDRDMKTLLAEGALQAVDNQVDMASGTVKIKALFPNKDLALFPNQFVNIRLQIETLKAALVVPAAALQRSPQGSFVYVATAAGTAEMRPVEILATEGDEVVLKGGVEPGESVITDGLEKLRPGSPVLLPGAGKKKP